MGDRHSDHLTEIEERYAGYQIYDRHYAKVGKVETYSVDGQDRLEYIG